MLREITDLINSKQDLSRLHLLWLLSQTGESELREIYALANEINRFQNGDRVSFVHNMNINYTNLCEEVCTFCAFKKRKDSSDAYILSSDQILEEIKSIPLSEITFQGGLTQEVGFQQVLDLVRAVKTHRPEIHMHAFSPEEIRYYAEREGLTFSHVIDEMKKAGSDSMCGTAAEVLDDEIRRQICPQKVTSQEWIDIVGMGHQKGMRSTATILFGHIETAEHIANHFERIRELQRRTGGITEFIPLLFIPDNTALGKKIKRGQSPYGAWAGEGTLTADRKQLAFRMLAISRIYFHNIIRNVQTSWVKLGFDAALESLSVGANDMSGTLYSETITREAGGTNGEYVSLEQFHEGICAIGKEPVERDTLYSYQLEPALS